MMWFHIFQSSRTEASPPGHVKSYIQDSHSVCVYVCVCVCVLFYEHLYFGFGGKCLFYIILFRETMRKWILEGKIGSP